MKRYKGYTLMTSMSGKCKVYSSSGEYINTYDSSASALHAIDLYL